MSEASTPKTWWEAVSANIVWGSLVFTCFLVFIEKLIEQHYGQALAAFILGSGIAAVAYHSKTWLEKTSPNWAFLAAAILVTALVTSPFVEQRRWPFSTVFRDPPSAEDIAKTTAPLREQLATATRERDAARSELADLKQRQVSAGTIPAPPPASAQGTRELTSKTVRQLKALHEGRTSLQAAPFIVDEIGKWMDAEGAILILDSGVALFRSGESDHVECRFDARWNPKLAAFRLGETLRVIGKIRTQGMSQLYLVECEIRD